jgi:hypothetical protein
VRHPRKQTPTGVEQHHDLLIASSVLVIARDQFARRYWSI